MDDREKLENALIKKALGFTTKEIVEEFNNVEDKLTLCKRKVNTKTVPPDLASLQILLGRLDAQNEYSDLDDSDLYAERDRLLKLLEKGGDNDHRRDDIDHKV